MSAPLPRRTDRLPHLVVMGVSGTGKTSVAGLLAERLGLTFVEGDALHPRANVAKMSAGQPLTDDDRAPWLAALAAEVRRHEALGAGTVLTCSALRRRYRDALRAGDAPGSRLFVHLEAPAALLREWMERREHFMPASLLDSQLATLEPLGADEPGMRVDVSAPLAVVVDRVVEALQQGSSEDGPRTGDPVVGPGR